MGEGPELPTTDSHEALKKRVKVGMANPIAHNYAYPKRSPIPQTYGHSLREIAKLRRKCGTLQGALELARV